MQSILSSEVSAPNFDLITKTSHFASCKKCIPTTKHESLRLILGIPKIIL